VLGYPDDQTLDPYAGSTEAKLEVLHDPIRSPRARHEGRAKMLIKHPFFAVLMMSMEMVFTDTLPGGSPMPTRRPT
jgi:hypothetical protein